MGLSTFIEVKQSEIVTISINSISKRKDESNKQTVYVGYDAHGHNDDNGGAHLV